VTGNGFPAFTAREPFDLGYSRPVTPRREVGALKDHISFSAYD